MNNATTSEKEAAPSCYEPSEQSGLSTTEAQDSARSFKALSDPNRLRLLSIVKAGEGGEACVCDLTVPLELGQPTVSHHLRILVDAGFLRREKRGTWAYYSLVPGSLEAAAARIVAL